MAARDLLGDLFDFPCKVGLVSYCLSEVYNGDIAPIVTIAYSCLFWSVSSLEEGLKHICEQTIFVPLGML